MRESTPFYIMSVYACVYMYVHTHTHTHTIYTFTFMHLADAFIQSDLQYIQVIHFFCQYVFPGNRTHNFYAANTMLYH